MEAGVQLVVPSLLRSGQCGPRRNARFPLKHLSPSPPYRCSTPSVFTGSLGPEGQLSVQVQDLHFLPQSRLPWRLFWGGWVIVTEHCIHTYSLCFVEGNFPRLILKGVILFMHGVLIFVCFLTS